jgi:hypothetical protein
VTCDAAGGFAHWNTTLISWRLNATGAGGGTGVATALQNAMAAWNGVAPAGYVLGYAGTTSRGFATDGGNTVLWANGNGCTGGCLAITALVLGPGQQILETDVSFNPSAAWSTSGNDYDVQSIAAHEFGHTLGIHHTDLRKRSDRPTMYASYFGTDGRSLQQDDRDALNCAYDRYPPGASSQTVGIEEPSASRGDRPGVRLVTRSRPGGALLRYGLEAAGHVKLDVYDVAGRRLTTLIDDVRAAGEHEVAWTGAAGPGRVGSGVYFARISTPNGTAGATVILME